MTAILPLVGWSNTADSRGIEAARAVGRNGVGRMGTVIFIVLCVVVLRALASTPSGPPEPGSWRDVLRVWGADVVDGARTLCRLGAARRARLERPPWGDGP